MRLSPDDPETVAKSERLRLSGRRVHVPGVTPTPVCWVVRLRWFAGRMAGVRSARYGRVLRAGRAGEGDGPEGVRLRTLRAYRAARAGANPDNAEDYSGIPVTRLASLVQVSQCLACHRDGHRSGRPETRSHGGGNRAASE